MSEQDKPVAWAVEWLRNNYQDHPTVADLCDAMLAAAPAPAAPELPALPEPIAKITKDTSGRLWVWGVNDSPYLDTAVSCDFVHTADQLHAAIAADRAARVPVLTDEQIKEIVLRVVYEGDASTARRDAWAAEIGIPVARAVLAAATQGST